MSITICYPWKMIGRYADDEEITVGGFNEEDCMNKLIDLQENHGELTWYSGYSDEDYEAGEYIGAGAGSGRRRAVLLSGTLHACAEGRLPVPRYR